MFGLAVPGGVVSTTGIAGLTLDGGQGWLCRTYGMTCDSLLSADVITADGAFVTASDTEHTDLFWVLRGGGGNFGFGTDFEYRLHAVGPVVTYASAMCRLDAAAAVLPAFRDYMDTATDAVNVRDTLDSSEHAGISEGLHGRSVIAVNGIYVGDGHRGEQILGAIRTLGDPIFDVLQPLPYTSVQRLVDVFFPACGLRYYWKGLYLDGLGDSVVSALAAAFARNPSPLSMLVIRAGRANGRHAGPSRHGVVAETAWLPVLRSLEMRSWFEACADLRGKQGVRQ